MITKEFLYTEWVTNLKSQREIAEENNVGLWLIEKLIKQYKLTGARSKVMYRYKEELFNFNDPAFCYFIGFMIADGYTDLKTRRAIISITDSPEVLQTLSQYFSKDKITPIYRYKTPGDKYSYRLTISSEYLISILENCGVAMQNKTSNVRFPSFPSKEMFKMALRGFIDGDGNIRYTKSALNLTMRWYSHSDNLVTDLVREFKKWYNYDLSVNSVKNKTGKELSTRVDFTNNVIDLYAKYPEYSLERKRKTVKNLVDDIVHRYEMINHSSW